MDEKIREALREAYVGEAKAALRLSMFADKAEQEGYPQIARLFRVIAFSEEIHGKRALRVLKEIKTTEENLAESFESEKTVAEIAYDRFVKMAEQAGDKQALLHFSQSHFMEERQTVYHVCKVCGYVADGVLPEECPVCAAKKDQFTTFDR
ncbi:MAG TPA: ferritin family protein [Smithellaceae bacterium]|nr:ferritin family protein [Smithellaceae bacterium]